MIENFAVVREGQVYRGAQYDDPADLLELGVKYVMKLNTYAEAVDTGPFAEIYLPIYLEEQLSPFGEIDMRMPLIYLVDAKFWPIYIHCQHGQDRTGLVVAMFRVLEDDWSVEDAEREMLAYGFHRELIGLWAAWERFKHERTHRQG